mgnify:FL=1
MTFPATFPMWIDKMPIAVSKLLGGLLLGGLLAVSSVSAQEQGQYRSRILLTPDGEWLEGADLSIEELEAQLGSIEETYAKSSAGRHLARHYVQRKEYDKAIAYYEEALAAEGLSAIANREMLREMAQVYLLEKSYGPAAETLQKALALNLVADSADYLLLARAYHQMGQYVEVVAALDQMQKDGLSLPGAQMQQALALYYRAGAFAQSEGMLIDLLQLQPDEPAHWHLLASVYLQQNKKRQALDHLALAREKLVPFVERDVLLLAGLQAVNNNPYGGAETLEQALSTNEVSASAKNYRRLFEFWLQAQEPGRARRALKQAAQLSGDTELYIYLAQLEMERQDFQAMHNTMLAACAKELPDAFVGRANLLLGISQLKLGDEQGARRSLINATLIGGVNAQAGQWLEFMNATPATAQEARRIVGICYGSRDKRLEATGSSFESSGAAPAGTSEFEVDAVGIKMKTVPPMRLFYAKYQGPPSELASEIQSTVVSMTVNLVKSGGSVRGPLQIIFSRYTNEQETQADIQLGLPTGGAVFGSGRFRVRTTEPFKCVYQSFEGSGPGLMMALAALAESALVANYKFTGEARIVLSAGADAETFKFEAQLGVR